MSFISRIMPFVVLGIMLVVLVAGFVLLSYLLVFGALVGLVLFAMAWLKEKILPPQKLPAAKREGRTFEHDDQQNP
jgi:hypothetical protein